jgi:hypothetical protein
MQSCPWWRNLLRRRSRFDGDTEDILPNRRHPVRLGWMSLPLSFLKISFLLVNNKHLPDWRDSNHTDRCNQSQAIGDLI